MATNTTTTEGPSIIGKLDPQLLALAYDRYNNPGKYGQMNPTEGGGEVWNESSFNIPMVEGRTVEAGKDGLTLGRGGRWFDHYNPDGSWRERTLADSGWVQWRDGIVTPAAMAALGYLGASALSGGAATAGGAAAGAAPGAVAAPAATGGMSGAELAAFLEANAGALAPGAEVAAGYGSAWGVGADGIIGAGATMAADGTPLVTGGSNPNYGNEGRNYPNQQSTTGSPANTGTGAPGGGGQPSGTPTKNPDGTWTVKDSLKVAQAGLQVAGSVGGGGGGGGGGGTPDERLADAQLRSMDLQSQMLERMISNADMAMPFQKDALDFSMRTAKEGYQDYRDDRQYALGRRGELTKLQDQAIAEAAGFNTDAKRAELRGQAVADVNRAYSGALDSAQRAMTRTGRSLNDGRWGSTLRQMVADKTLAQAQAGTMSDRAARAEGRSLVDRAASMVSGAPGLAMSATGGAQGAGASTVPLAGQSLQSMNSGLASVGQLAGSLGTNATAMADVQRKIGGGGGGTDWSAAGALLGGLTKAYDIWGG